MYFISSASLIGTKYVAPAPETLNASGGKHLNERMPVHIQVHSVLTSILNLCIYNIRQFC